MSGKKKGLIAAVVVIALALGMGILYYCMGEGTSVGSKAVGVSVTFADGTVTEHELSTDAEFLYDAMVEAELIEATDSEYGKWIVSVEGYAADEAKGEYWLFTKGEEWVMTSVDTTPIADGEHYEFFIYTE